jgi:hypothetical protein
MTPRANDGWLPVPGSWEEAVEPYELQLTRRLTLEDTADRHKELSELHLDPPVSAGIPATL